MNNCILPLDSCHYIENLLKNGGNYFVKQQSFLLNDYREEIIDLLDQLLLIVKNLWSDNINTKNIYINDESMDISRDPLDLNILFLPTLDGYFWQLWHQLGVNDITFIIKNIIYIKIRYRGIYFTIGYINKNTYHQWIRFCQYQLKLNFINEESFSTIISYGDLNLRWSCFPSLNGLKSTIRILNNKFIQWENFRCHPQCYKILLSIIFKKTFIGICGLTGTGKTTLAYGINKYLVDHGFHCVSMEQPIEYNNDFFDQSLNNNNELMDHLLRHDIDTIFFGEILDQESAKKVQQFIHTGHGVISTFHIGKPQDISLRWNNFQFSGYLIFPKILFYKDLSYSLMEIYDDKFHLLTPSYEDQISYFIKS